MKLETVLSCGVGGKDRCRCEMYLVTEEGERKLFAVGYGKTETAALYSEKTLVDEAAALVDLRVR